VWREVIVPGVRRVESKRRQWRLYRETEVVVVRVKGKGYGCHLRKRKVRASAKRREKRGILGVVAREEKARALA
jgi:hypothetical protein